MNKKRMIWAVIVCLLVAAGLYTYTYLTNLEEADQAANQSEAFTTAVARIGDLTILASGTGEVIPAAEFGLTFDASGTILEVPVQVGDQVEAGDVLAILKSDKTEAELAAEIAIAELGVVQAQAALDDHHANAEMAAAQALVELEQALLALDEIQDLELEKALALQTVAYAEEAKANAEMLLYIYNSSPSEEDIYTAYASWLFKQEILDDLTKMVNTTILRIKGATGEAQQDQLENQLLQLNLQQANQRLEVEDAIFRINTIDEAADPLDVAVAESQLATAQAKLAAAQKEYEILLEGPNLGELAMAEATLAKAKTIYNRIKEGPYPEEVTRLEIQLKKAELDLEILQDETTIIELIAPIDSTVTSLNMSVGDRIDVGGDDGGDSSDQDEISGPQTDMDIIESILFGSTSSTTASSDSLVTLADLSRPLLEIYVDESDLFQVGLGYPVEIQFDALPDEVFTGEIIEINPSLESISNVMALRTVVLLDVDSYAKPNALPIGSSAQVEVVAGQAVGAVLIPVEALVEAAPGEYIVFVVENDQPQQRKVEVGLINFTTAEIIKGLQTGETVALGYGFYTGN